MLHNTLHYTYKSHNALWERGIQARLVWMYTGDTSGISRRSGYFQHTVNLAFGLERAYYILAKLVSTADKVGGLEYSFRPFYYSHIDKSKHSFTRAASGILGLYQREHPSYCNYYQGKKNYWWIEPPCWCPFSLESWPTCSSFYYAEVRPLNNTGCMLPHPCFDQVTQIHSRKQCDNDLSIPTVDLPCGIAAWSFSLLREHHSVLKILEPGNQRIKSQEIVFLGVKKIR